MINELTIKNFRGFTSLELKDLKRVNLVVGENNSGKTSLLEGILLLCQPRRVTELPGLLRAKEGDPEKRYFRWLLRDGVEHGLGELGGKAGNDEWSAYLGGPKAREEPTKLFEEEGLRFALPVVYQSTALTVWGSEGQNRHPCRIISDQHHDPSALVGLVGKVPRKGGGEETLQGLLAKVDPRIRKVRVDPGEDGNQVIVDIGLSDLIPLSQAGQGVYRLVGILAEIIGESPEVVLIDEVENGLHHSIHRKIWAGLAEAADRLNVQIFATTHSGECLRAAHDVFLDRQTYDFAVIRLFRVESGVQGWVLDREHIEAAIEGNIDLR